MDGETLSVYRLRDGDQTHLVVASDSEDAWKVLEESTGDSKSQILAEGGVKRDWLPFSGSHKLKLTEEDEPEERTQTCEEWVKECGRSYLASNLF